MALNSKAVGKLLTLTLPPISFNSKIHLPILVFMTIIVGVLVAWLPLPVVVLLVSGTIFFILTLLNPVVGLYTLIPIIPFSSLLAMETAGVRVGLMEFVLLCTLAAWGLKILTRPPESRRPIQGGPLLPAFLLFLGAISLSWLVTFSIGASLVESAKWIEMLALYLLVINLLPAGHIKWAVALILLTGVAQALLGLYQFIFRVGPPGFELFGGRFLRAYGAFAQPNPYGGYLGLVLPLALSLTLWNLSQISKAIAQTVTGNYAPRGSVTPAPRSAQSLPVGQTGLERSHILFRLILVSLPLVILLAALFASQSRGAWLGFVGAGIVIFTIRSKKSAAMMGGLFVVVILIVLAGSFEFSLPGDSADENIGYAAVTQRFVAALEIVAISDVATIPVTDANFATIERLAHWQAAREMWQDNPWLGVGFGNYAAVYPAYAVGRWLDPLGHAHNYLLNLGAEAGLLGITVYLIFWIFAFGLLWAAIRRSQHFYQAVAIGAVGIMVHLHVHNLVDNLYVQGMYLHIAIILGLVSVIYLQDRPATQ
jgi:O-antigen ligase